MTDAPLPGLIADDLARLRWALEPDIDRSGRRAAYVVAGCDAATDRLDHYVVIVPDVDRPDRTIPIGWAAPTRRPRWSPDGSRLALLAINQGRWQLALADERGALTFPADIEGDATWLSWAPDGRQIAVERVGSDSTGGSTTAVTDVDTGAVTSLRGAEPGVGRAGSASCVEWALDGTHLGYIASGRVWVTGAGKNSSAAFPLEIAGTARTIAWSPDGRRLAVLTGPPEAEPWANGRLFVVDVAGRSSAIELGTDLDRSIGQVVRGDDERGIGVASLAWSAEDDAVLAIVADGGTSSIVSFPLDGAPSRISTGHAAVLDFAAADDGSIAYTWSDGNTPGEMSVLRPDGRDEVCSDLTSSLHATRRVAPTTIVRAGGIDGWLTMPIDASSGPFPLVVQVHGGPHYPVGERFSFDAQRLAAAGYATLRGNPRGAQGYGAGHAAAIAGDWGGGDADDAEALVDATLREHPIDPTRIAVIGESYGGFLALSLAARSDRFVAIVAENAVSDLAAARQVNPGFWDAELAAHDSQSMERAERRSPITNAPSIHVPVLLVHAAEDAVVPHRQSVAMLTALRHAGAPAELLTIDGEDHMTNVFGRPSRRIAKLRAVGAFLARHLARHPAGRLGATPSSPAGERQATGANHR